MIKKTLERSGRHIFTDWKMKDTLNGKGSLEKNSLSGFGFGVKNNKFYRSMVKKKRKKENSPQLSKFYFRSADRSYCCWKKKFWCKIYFIKKIVYTQVLTCRYLRMRRRLQIHFRKMFCSSWFKNKKRTWNISFLI